MSNEMSDKMSKNVRQNARKENCKIFFGKKSLTWETHGVVLQIHGFPLHFQDPKLGSSFLHRDLPPTKIPPTVLGWLRMGETP